MYVATNPSYRLMVSATHLLYEPIVSRRSSGSYRCPSSELKRALVYNHLRARCTWSNFTVMAARLSIQNFVVCLSLHTVSGGGDEMTNDTDRKTYWDLLETLRWIGTRDEQLVAAMWDWNDDKKMAVVLFGMKEQRGIRSLPGPSGSNRGVDLDPAAPQGDGAPIRATSKDCCSIPPRRTANGPASGSARIRGRPARAKHSTWCVRSAALP